LNLKIKALFEDVTKTGNAKNVIKNDNTDLNEKVIQLEEELFEQKNITVELLE